jgi:uncharacterized protein YjeT (DUF2065 family)
MSTILLYVVALVASQALGASAGIAVSGLLFGEPTKREYTKRLLRGLVFGGTTVVASVYVLKWLALPARFFFVAVLSGIFILLIPYNHAKVKAAMRKHDDNKLIYAKLDELLRTRLVQDVAAAISAVVMSFIVYRHII